MGGGYSSSRGGWDGGNTSGTFSNPQDLISQRERKESEVDQTLTVLRQVENQYGMNLNSNTATISPANALGMYASDPNNPANGQLILNRSFFNQEKMNSAWDESAKTGYHPSRGNKTGIEGVVAHEMGHALTGKASERLGEYNLDKTAGKIVQEAKQSMGYKGRASDMARKISGYAGANPAECVAEAFADVYCNGNRAKAESKAVVNTLNKYARP